MVSNFRLPLDSQNPWIRFGALEIMNSRQVSIAISVHPAQHVTEENRECIQHSKSRATSWIQISAKELRKPVPLASSALQDPSPIPWSHYHINPTTSSAAVVAAERNKSSIKDRLYFAVWLKQAGTDDFVKQ